LSITWGKSDRIDPTDYHLLIYHMLDAAAVAQVLWNECLSDSIKEEISSICCLNIARTGEFLSTIVGFHDIGKASPVFQAKNNYLAKHWNLLKVTLPKVVTNEIYHAEIGCIYLIENNVVPEWAAIAISGHHGRWNFNLRNKHYYSDQYGDIFWEQLRRYLVKQLVDTISNEFPIVEVSDTQKQNMLAVWLSGFICMADWISSNQDYFKNTKEFTNELKDYYKAAYIHALSVVIKLGWRSWKADGKEISFTDMFACVGIAQPRPIQQKIIEEFDNWNKNNSPFLMVIEAPTGIGKTEIALYIADKWLQTGKRSGIYIAMPTMATSNMIFKRCLEIFSNRYVDEDTGQFVNVVLAHGQAGWDDQINQIRLKEIGDSEGENLTIAAMDWFQNNRKRSLLAPFGIGTVDQVFMAVLQTRHFFVRMAGLKNKVIIFDEVHAYDVYMNTLFHRLLSWLRVMGTSVIVLSATLPNETRKEILSAYSGIKDSHSNTINSYPLTSFVTYKNYPNFLDLSHHKPDKRKIVRIKWIEEEKLTMELSMKLREGGCAAIICNTVKKAQTLYRNLKPFFQNDLILFHAQYPNAWRSEKEKKIFSFFGKNSTLENGNRPYRAIVISTQIIEQSLDIDFDVIFSELAPVDLIIQRIGRLHRHDRSRISAELANEPQFYLFNLPFDKNDLPDVSKRERFYNKSVLLKSYFVLKQHEKIKIDDVTKQYIEQVYGKFPITNIPEPLIKKINQYQTDEINKENSSKIKAIASIIPESEDEDLLYQPLMGLVDEEHMEFKDALHAQTRDFNPSIQCVCFFQEGDKFYLANREEGKKEIDLNSLQSDKPPIKELFESSISITNRKAITLIRGNKPEFSLPNNLHYLNPINFQNGQFFEFGLSYEYGFFEDT